MIKHNLVNLSKLVVLSAVALLATASTVSADECSTQYGNGTTCQPTKIDIDKKVRNPITGSFVENLLSGDAAYSPNSEVIYLLKISNTSNQNFTDVTVTDTLPIQLNSGAVVDSDKAKVKDEKFENNTIIFKLKDELKAGSTIEIQVKAKVRDASVFTEVKTCDITNTGRVQAGDNSKDNTAKICVTKDVLGTTTLPQAGPEDYLPLLPFLGLGITGIALFFRKPAIVG